MKQVWKCDYCSQTDVVSDKILKHEPKCVFNKATKHCYTCKFSREDGYEDHIAGCDIDSTEPSICERFCPITKKEKDALLKITPIKTPKMPKATKVDTKVDNTVEVSNVFIEDLIAEFDVVLDVDTILEKISMFGIKSLNKKELDFLNSFSK